MGRVRPGVLAVCVALGGCGAEQADEPVPASEAVTSPAEAGPEPVAVYERGLVFMTSDTDSTLTVPLLFRSQDDTEGTDRTIQGWLARNGAWESFVDETWRTPPTRAPWRLLPRGPLRLVVGLNDALEEVVFEQGARSLVVDFGSLLAEWTDPGGQVYRLHDGAIDLSNRRVSGILLDVNRTRRPGGSHGDWGLLLSGDSLQMIIDAVRPSDVPLGGASARARLHFRQIEWTDLVMEWSDVRAFEPARRDVPVSWRIGSNDGTVQGRLRVETTEADAGAGSGRLLPVYALFEVSGQVELEGRAYDVRGLIRHEQN